MASKKSGAAAGNTYVISPQSPGDFFPARTAQEIMRRCLAEGLNQGHLVDVRAAKHPSEPYNAELTKPIAEAIRDKLKAICPDRYKLFVQVVVAENKGQGLRVASRALWDPSTDVLASETHQTDNVVAVATCHAVYLP